MKNKKLFMTFAIMAVMVATLIVGVSAEAVTGASAITEVNTGLTTSLADFSVTNLMSIITNMLTLCVPLIIAWFAFRWIFGHVKGALRKGN